MSGLVSISRFWRLCLKELRETLRDRRTIITLVLMPLLVYPLLSQTLNRVLLSTEATFASTKLRFGLENAETANLVLDIMKIAQEGMGDPDQRTIVIKRDKPKSLAAEGDVPTIGSVDQELQNIELIPVSESAEDDLRTSGVDLLIRATPMPPVRGIQTTIPPHRFDVIYRQDDIHSQRALELFATILQSINEEFGEQLLQSIGVPASPPVRMVANPLKADEDSGSIMLATIIPLVLVLMTITGAVYPAIDLTAGERERGTMEALIASPVPRVSLLLAKYVAVVMVALLTAVANMVAMMVTLRVTGLSSLLLGDGNISYGLMLQIFGLMVLFAMFFSAVLLAITSFARSFKEAQAYLIPVMLVALAPGVLSLLPGIKLTLLMAIAPLVNIVLLARELLSGGAPLPLAFAAVLSTLVYAIAAVGIAARLFGSDAVMQGGRESWRELLGRPKQPRQYPAVDQMVIFLAILFPIYFVFSNMLGGLDGGGLAVKLISSSIVTAIIFGLLPTAYALYRSCKLTTTFRLQLPSVSIAILVFPGAILLGLSLWMAAHELFVISEQIGLITMREGQLKTAAALVEELKNVSPFLILLTLAASPAIFEEYFFRGFVLGALASRSKKPRNAWSAIILSAVLFGLFHVVVSNVLSIERFLPSTLMGLALGWVALRTGSLWPGVVLHGCHNGLLMMTAYYKDQIQAAGWGLEESSHLPITWLAVGVVTAAAGGALVYFGSAVKASPEIDGGEITSELERTAELQ